MVIKRRQVADESVKTRTLAAFAFLLNPTAVFEALDLSTLNISVSPERKHEKF